MNASTGASLKLDGDLVPESLRHLIPVVEKWGYSRPQEQDDYKEYVTLVEPFIDLLTDSQIAKLEFCRKRIPS